MPHAQTHTDTNISPQSNFLSMHIFLIVSPNESHHYYFRPRLTRGYSMMLIIIWGQVHLCECCCNHMLDIGVKIATINIKLRHSSCHTELMVFTLRGAGSLLFVSRWRLLDFINLCACHSLGFVCVVDSWWASVLRSLVHCYSVFYYVISLISDILRPCWDMFCVFKAQGYSSVKG